MTAGAKEGEEGKPWGELGGTDWDAEAGLAWGAATPVVPWLPALCPGLSPPDPAVLPVLLVLPELPVLPVLLEVLWEADSCLVSAGFSVAAGLSDTADPAVVWVAAGLGCSEAAAAGLV